MNIVLGSCFRNSAGRHLSLYAERVAALAAALPPGDTLRLALVWGDSTDRTEEALARYAALAPCPVELVARHHGQPWYGSTEQPERLKAFGFAAGGAFAAVTPADDAFAYVESDLIWTPGTLVGLLRRLGKDVDVVAPLTVVDGTDVNYDLWGCRQLDGRRTSPFAPYFDPRYLREHERADGLVEVGTVGSCLAVRGVVARSVPMGDGALVGWCEAARAGGARVWMDPVAKVYHPC